MSGNFETLAMVALEMQALEDKYLTGYIILTGCIGCVGLTLLIDDCLISSLTSFAFASSVSLEHL